VRDHFEVVARGWVPALIYYIAVAASDYLLATFYRTQMPAMDTGAMLRQPAG
jgi:hypothetical protein